MAVEKKPITLVNDEFDIRYGFLMKYKPKAGWMVIPEGVTETGYYAVVNKNIESVTFPKSLKLVGHGSFCHCDKITSIDIPNGVETLSPYSFSGCKELREVTLNKGLKEIGNKAFFQCPQLESITIPSSVEKIGPYAFAECGKLSEVRISKKTAVSETAFFKCPENLSIKFY